MKISSAAFATFAVVAAAAHGFPCCVKKPKVPFKFSSSSSNSSRAAAHSSERSHHSVTGTTTFGTQKWNGPLVTLSGTNLTLKGNGKLDGQGYWKQGQQTTRPVFFQMHKVIHSTVSSFTIMNAPYRTFSIVDSMYTTISGLMLDSRAGNGVATNTDGFDLSCNDHITITGNTIYNQDDCLAMQSSTNTFFTNNHCYNSHGISVGSLGGSAVDRTTTVSGLTVQGNHIHDSDNGLRTKTIIGLKGLVTDVKFIDNEPKREERYRGPLGLQQIQGWLYGCGHESSAEHGRYCLGPYGHSHGSV
ncbi:unnamed protein product [Phytophthora lilii]|uniref:endo-polygalacturonase n=1 Tax=Phytophthora lilii TaxID=2077276 RepID=A0A9W6UCC2_9STRA|nr:unnamed protein product [Phytophthora lilii]